MVVILHTSFWCPIFIILFSVYSSYRARNRLIGCQIESFLSVKTAQSSVVTWSVSLVAYAPYPELFCGSVRSSVFIILSDSPSIYSRLWSEMMISKDSCKTAWLGSVFILF